jgi:hypothetical protein
MTSAHSEGAPSIDLCIDWKAPFPLAAPWGRDLAELAEQDEDARAADFEEAALMIQEWALTRAMDLPKPLLVTFHLSFSTVALFPLLVQRIEDEGWTWAPLQDTNCSLILGTPGWRADLAARLNRLAP